MNKYDEQYCINPNTFKRYYVYPIDQNLIPIVSLKLCVERTCIQEYSTGQMRNNLAERLRSLPIEVVFAVSTLN